VNELRILYHDPYQDPYERVVDISEIVETCSWSTSLGATPGQLRMTIVGELIEFAAGALVEVFDGDRGVFMGYVFAVRLSQEQHVEVTAYDQTRYLKNQDTLVFGAMPMHQVFLAICEQYGLRFGTVDEVAHSCAPAVHEGRSLWDVLQSYADETLARTGKLYIVRDNFGELELRDVDGLHTDLLIDDVSVITAYDYEISIADRTYNQIKLGKESKSAKSRMWTIVKDSTRIREWGLLQFHQKMGEGTPDGELEQLGESLLRIYNRPSQTLSLVCLGEFIVQAGSGVQVSLSALQATTGGQNYIVKDCEHTVTNDNHTMKLELALDSV
jgi:hypothetical protein